MRVFLGLSKTYIDRSNIPSQLELQVVERLNKLFKMQDTKHVTIIAAGEMGGSALGSALFTYLRGVNTRLIVFSTPRLIKHFSQGSGCWCYSHKLASSCAQIYLGSAILLGSLIANTYGQQAEGEFFEPPSDPFILGLRGLNGIEMVSL